MKNHRIAQLFLIAGLMTALSAVAAPVPKWIWHSNGGQTATNNEVRLFRKTFFVEGKVRNALLAVAADNSAEVFLNDAPVVVARGYDKATTADVTAWLRAGENVLAVRGVNSEGPAAFTLRLEVFRARNAVTTVVSDESWLAGAGDEPANWRAPGTGIPAGWLAAKDVKASGGDAWREVFKAPPATAAGQLQVPPGFKVELLHSAGAHEGSWICLTMDTKGRLIISPQRDDQPLLRVTLNRGGQVEQIEPIPAPLRQAMGLCYAHNSLYVNGHGPKGTGLYRLIDANRNDRFDTNEVHFLKKFAGEGEHGYHAVVEGPDGMIYVMSGNHTKVPEGVAKDSPHRNYQEDLFLPRQWDAGGHAVGVLAPGGYIVRTDPAGRKWELLLAGFRNSYDFDFNADGEIFTFDSDMEWDWGLPWYRPTRVNHCVIGGEYGWRSGSAKEPDYYADTLPATVNIGIGSPTGVKFGMKSNFPEKYRRALFVMDWSYGRILAVHTVPRGASYAGNFENFVKGKPLNVTDLDFGTDGAMYFTTGGRGTQSGLYRVSYVGGDARSDVDAETKQTLLKVTAAAGEARALRHQLERFHGKKSPVAVGVAWPHLSSPDRFIRYAARIAIESQDVAFWKSRALTETNPQAALTALLALARCGGRDAQNDLLYALLRFTREPLTEEQLLEGLRAMQLSFSRQGKPEAALVRMVAEQLDGFYPAASERVNRELSSLLVFLDSPHVIAKTLALIERAQTQEEQIHYIFQLRNLKYGWTLEQRQRYFSWFTKVRQGGRSEVTYPAGAPYNVWTNQLQAVKRHPAQLVQWFKDVDREYGDGSSFAKYLVNIRKDAIAKLTSAERNALAPLLAENINAEPWKPVLERKFVKEWTLADFEGALDQVAGGRDFKSGKYAFNDAQCISCHRFGNEGGAVGPELTGVGSKYSRRDILESLLDPSKVVSDQYQNTTIVKKDGDDITGRITDENGERVIVLPNMLATEATVEIPLSEIARREPSKISPMPNGLLNNLTKEEILDLLAYLESAGRANATNFKRESGSAK